MINILIIILLTAVIAILLSGTRAKGIITVSVVIIQGLITGYFGVRALLGLDYNVTLSGTAMFGHVPVVIDALSGWFIITIDFTMITGAIYGFNYMRKYLEQKNDLTLHCVAFLLAHFALLGICSVRNGFVFLLLWELMAISLFLLIIFEHHKPETIRSGLNYIVQSHISIVFLMLGFMYVAFKTGSFGFDAITEFSTKQGVLAGTALFLFFFVGFAIKSGFVPFHTWLPYAHPAAPSHVSGIMSGVVIKIGIYGILRMLLLIKTDYTTIGYLILFISIFTGIYGVMLATIQHNLKKLLAYHSIENIGIIGTGIGIGCLGLGSTNKWMAILGFSGALLHTLNHSLFKSLLFFSTGSVYQATGTVNIEHLGGLIKKMPRTSILFLTGAIAICGLPPLNGFVSEFLILGGLYNWLYSANLISLITIVFSLGGLVFIGGLAIFCFTKAFSVVFLGNSRNVTTDGIRETRLWQLIPMYLIASFMISIGLFPSFYLKVVQRPVNLFTHDIVFNLNLMKVGAIDSLQTINWLFFGFIALVLIVYLVRMYANGKRVIDIGATWGCGYSQVGPNLEYTGSSFVRNYSKLAKPILDIERKESEIAEIFPEKHYYETSPYDKIERFFIDKPLKLIYKVPDIFLFLQNGQLQRYILYGIIFIISVISLPIIIDKFLSLLHFLTNL